jgi:hypothetical protein
MVYIDISNILIPMHIADQPAILPKQIFVSTQMFLYFVVTNHLQNGYIFRR